MCTALFSDDRHFADYGCPAAMLVTGRYILLPIFIYSFLYFAS